MQVVVVEMCQQTTFLFEFFFFLELLRILVVQTESHRGCCPVQNTLFGPDCRTFPIYDLFK